MRQVDQDISRSVSHLCDLEARLSHVARSDIYVSIPARGACLKHIHETAKTKKSSLNMEPLKLRKLIERIKSGLRRDKARVQEIIPPPFPDAFLSDRTRTNASTACGFTAAGSSAIFIILTYSSVANMRVEEDCKAWKPTRIHFGDAHPASGYFWHDTTYSNDCTTEMNHFSNSALVQHPLIERDSARGLYGRPHRLIVIVSR
ncbi:hypothetical protein AC578_8860 [Pseudocercospora eumusae]|uniref:Uncharacterized protein n=1 Tax=Pseudocercospora eumusae TaxID=321146 RepID=A0A139H5S2_9PEZI|nr:hypothetical protein AC578_8860 [Pseudocercospora eumusae]